jgi:hypothetical protein
MLLLELFFKNGGQQFAAYAAEPGMRHAVVRLFEEFPNGPLQTLAGNAARGTPPKMAVLGAPTSSRFRQETGNDCRMCSSMSFMFTPL